MRRFIPWLSICLLLAGCAPGKGLRLMHQGETSEPHFLATVPFELRNGIIVVKVDINGRDYDFLLDSGSPTCLFGGAGDSLGLPDLAEAGVLDIKGTISYEPVTSIPLMKIGTAGFTNTGAFKAGNVDVGISCKELDGIVGTNLLRQAAWQIDFRNQTLTFASSIDSLNIPQGALHIPFDPDRSGAPFIRINIAGQVAKNVMVDLGFNGDIVLSKSILGRLMKSDPGMKVFHFYGSSSSGMFGPGPPDSLWFARVPWITIGTDTVKRTFAEFSGARHSLLGSGFLEHFLVTIDWKSRELILSPVDDPRWNSIITPGITFHYREPCVYVAGIYEGSAASRMPIRVGDQVISINGKDVSDITPAQWCALFNEKLAAPKPGQVKLSLKNSAGVVTDVVLQDQVLGAE